MTSMLLMMLLSHAERTGNSSGGAAEPMLSAFLVEQWRYLTRVEVTTLALLPQAGVCANEGFAQVESILLLDSGPEFGVSEGAFVRLRMWCRWSADAGLVRQEDWDTLSNWEKLLEGDGALRPGTFTPVCLGMDNAR